MLEKTLRLIVAVISILNGTFFSSITAIMCLSVLETPVIAITPGLGLVLLASALLAIFWFWLLIHVVTPSGYDKAKERHEEMVLQVNERLERSRK